jgi:hypothetical protein
MCFPTRFDGTISDAGAALDAADAAGFDGANSDANAAG